jgi:uncharacterized lipoprotein YehR (DUF1307 family)
MMAQIAITKLIHIHGIRVNTDEAGKLSFSFCDLEVKKSGFGACDAIQYLTGKVAA